MRTPDEIWTDLDAVRRALEEADEHERPGLEARREALRAEADGLAVLSREGELRRELKAVETELEALLDAHIGTTGKKRNFVMGFVYGDHDSGVHLAKLNEQIDEAGGRAELERRRLELREVLGLEAGEEV